MYIIKVWRCLDFTALKFEILDFTLPPLVKATHLLMDLTMWQNKLHASVLLDSRVGESTNGEAIFANHNKF